MKLLILLIASCLTACATHKYQLYTADLKRYTPLMGNLTLEQCKFFAENTDPEAIKKSGVLFYGCEEQ